MKSILISIKPEWVAKILNGEKTIEVRKTAPKCELPVDVYIYCTKGLGLQKFGDKYFAQEGQYPVRNGKVVAKFKLNKVDWFCTRDFWGEYKEGVISISGSSDPAIFEKSCVSQQEIDEYTKGKPAYAWHISDLEIFDEPKDLSEFKYEKKKVRLTEKYHWKTERLGLAPVKKAPQSWQYVEEKE